jgi:subtilisin family serine protease
MTGLSLRPQQLICTVETLEPRRLLAMNWGAYPKLIDQDEAVADFPNITGKGVNVAIIDSGWDFNHPKLQGRLWTNPGEVADDGIDNDGDGQIDNVHGWDFMRADNHPDDENGHGTQMAGIIAGLPFEGLDGFEYQGLAPDAKIIPLKTIDGYGTIYTLSFAQRVERALKWIEGNHKRYNISIVSMSIGVHKPDFEATFADEVKRLNEAGVLLIASAGHFGRATLEYPAADPNVYSAGVVDVEDRIPQEQQRGPDLDILGPGSKIQILHKGSAYIVSGTASSYPTPFIAGAAALIKQINPDWKPAQIMDILRDSGKQVSDGENSYPRIDLDNAIRLAIQRRDGTPDPDPDPNPNPRPKKQTPFRKTPFNITSRIEAENFDGGGEKISFHNVSRRKQTTYRRTPVELLASTDDGGGYYVASTRRGEWLEYTVNVSESRAYTFQGRFQVTGKGAAFHVEVDGRDVTGRLAIPNGGKNAQWKTISKRNISLTSGRRVVRIFFDSATSKKSAGNFNWFQFNAG